MRNRAKCRKCQSIIESFALLDYIECKCKAIAISGGTTKFEVYAHDYSDLIRVDDSGNEIVPKIVEKAEADKEIDAKESEKPLDDPLKMLDDHIRYYQDMPEGALIAPITGYDLL